MQQRADNGVDDWIPHRGGMQLLDRILEADDDQAVAEVNIQAQGLFVRDGRVPPWVGIEYMAQTISAWAGGRGQRAGNAGPKVGLLLGSRRYDAHCDGFAIGSTLRVEARCQMYGDNGLGLFDCRILDGGRELATATISVFEPDDAMAFIREGTAP